MKRLIHGALLCTLLIPSLSPMQDPSVAEASFLATQQRLAQELMSRDPIRGVNYDQLAIRMMAPLIRLVEHYKQDQISASNIRTGIKAAISASKIAAHSDNPSFVSILDQQTQTLERVAQDPAYSKTYKFHLVDGMVATLIALLKITK